MMSEQVISVLDALCEKFGVAIDWTQENVLPYARELCGRYINYEIATSVAWIVILVAITSALILAAVKLNKMCDWNSSVVTTSDVMCGVSIFFALVIGVASVFVIVEQVFDIITCLTFPEKMIIEFASGLIKTG